MRLGVLDVGSNAVHLLVVEARRLTRRARLPGISPHRARQILAGAVVAYTAMKRLHVDEVQICPWALREGILLRQLEAQQPPLREAAWVPWRRPEDRAAVGEPALVAA